MGINNKFDRITEKSNIIFPSLRLWFSEILCSIPIAPVPLWIPDYTAWPTVSIQTNPSKKIHVKGQENCKMLLQAFQTLTQINAKLEQRC